MLQLTENISQVKTKNKLINKKDYESIINHIANSKLPSSLNKFFTQNDAKKILSFMLGDKKNRFNKIYNKDNLYKLLKLAVENLIVIQNESNLKIRKIKGFLIGILLNLLGIQFN